MQKKNKQTSFSSQINIVLAYNRKLLQKQLIYGFRLIQEIQKWYRVIFADNHGAANRECTVVIEISMGAAIRKMMRAIPPTNRFLTDESPILMNI